MSSDTNKSLIFVPKDVWSLIVDEVSFEYVYEVVMKSSYNSTNTVELGVFKKEADAYKTACAVLGNYWIGHLMDGGLSSSAKTMYDFIHRGIVPQVLKPQTTLISNYNEMFQAIQDIVKLLTVNVNSVNGVKLIITVNKKELI